MRSDVKPRPVPSKAAVATRPAAFVDLSAVELLRKTLIALVLLLTFEGLVRKLQPGAVGAAVFLLKDAVVMFMAFNLMRVKFNPAINFLIAAYIAVAFFMVPNILETMGHDPALAVFGAKEYLLYPIVGVVTFVVFENKPMSEVVKFGRLVAFLMVPAGLIAILQTRLPVTSWINLSVDGASLEDFSSAGHLRVSSTFSFVSQFCCFLNVQMFMILLALYGGIGKLSFRQKLMYLTPFPLLIICCYLTGSRGAVVGNTMVLVFAGVLAVIRGELAKVMRFVWIGVAIAVIALLFQSLAPDLMSTYTVREKGHAFGVSTEIWGRVWDAFFGWTDHISEVPFFGHGLGLMSNASQPFSAYSKNFRIASGWTETDFATTLVEGGPYLMVVWYAFRYFIIVETTRRFLFQTSKKLFLPGALCQGYVILVGLTGTLSIQPPIAIWWWLGVGISTILWWRSIHPLPGDPDFDPGEKRVGPIRPMRPATAVGGLPVEERLEVPKPDVPKQPTAPLPPPTKPVRGRSTYADRLHKRP